MTTSHQGFWRLGTFSSVPRCSQYLHDRGTGSARRGAIGLEVVVMALVVAIASHVSVQAGLQHLRTERDSDLYLRLPKSRAITTTGRMRIDENPTRADFAF